MEEALSALRLKVEALEKANVQPVQPANPAPAPTPGQPGETPAPVAPTPGNGDQGGTPAAPQPAAPTPAEPAPAQPANPNKYIIRKDNGQKLYISGPKVDPSELTSYVLANGDAQLDEDLNPKPGVEVFTE